MSNKWPRCRGERPPRDRRADSRARGNPAVPVGSRSASSTSFWTMPSRVSRFAIAWTATQAGLADLAAERW